MDTDRTLERIVRAAGVPDLLEALAERLSPTDLQTLLLETYRRRAATVTPARLLAAYGRTGSRGRPRWRRRTWPGSTR